VTEVFECEKNPNLQGKITAADFVFDTPFKNIDLSGFVIEYEKKGKAVREDVSDRIYRVADSGGRLSLRLAAGNTSLRPDRILPELNARLGVALALSDIRKTAQYVGFANDAAGGFEDADDYLKRV